MRKMIAGLSILDNNKHNHSNATLYQKQYVYRQRIQGCKSNCNNSVGYKYSGFSRSVEVFNTFRGGSQTKLSPCKTKFSQKLS